MPSKKRLPASGKSPRWQVILEKIESENRMTIEAVELNRQMLQAQIEKADRESRQRDDVLEAAIHSVRTELKADVNRVETKVDKIDARLQVVETKVDRLEVKVDRIDARLQTVEIKVDLLVPLEGRVTALERRPA